MKVIVSYAHEDDKARAALQRHLALLTQEGHIELWHDRRIGPSVIWNVEIEEKFETADVVLFLVTPYFLGSSYIRDKEIPWTLERAKKNEIRVVPIITAPCDWESAPFADYQALPKDGLPITDWPTPDHGWLDVAKALRLWIVQTPGWKPVPFAKSSLHRLPHVGPELFGRESVLETLIEAWEDPDVHVFTVVAAGGVGKSAVVKRWIVNLEKEIGGACPVFAWSFYSQGTHKTYTSSDPFFDAALKFFEVSLPDNAPPDTKAEALAGFLAQRRAILILDGLEPMQWGPGEYENELKDRALSILLTTLARHNAGLCVVTTRVPVADLDEWGMAKQVDLELLSEEAGVNLLQALGVFGEEEDLREATQNLGNHALAITLLGTWLKKTWKGDIRLRDHLMGLPPLGNRPGRHASRIMDAYGSLFGEDSVEHAILSILGLYDRPAPIEEIAILQAYPAIPGLTNAIVGLDDNTWNSAISSLRELRLLLDGDKNSLDAHPLVRENFSEHLKTKHYDAWRSGHNRLYEHLRDTTEKQPETLEGLEPLYRAIRHGCAAERMEETLNELYYPRVQRNGSTNFSCNVLGAFSSDLEALSGFFSSPWNSPSPKLSEEDQSLLLNWAAYRLRALGRLREAVEPLERGLALRESQGEWTGAANAGGTVSQLWLALGEIERAIEAGTKAIAHAGKVNAYIWQIGNRAYLANALHQKGMIKESTSHFENSEKILIERSKNSKRFKINILYSIAGFYYCDLLIEQGATSEAIERAQTTIEFAKRENRLLDIAFDTLTMAHAAIASGETGTAETKTLMNLSVDRLRRAGALHHLPRGLIVRASGLRKEEDFDGACGDLDESERLCRRGELKLLLADTLLERTRVEHDQNKPNAALATLKKAKSLIEGCRYERRNKTVKKLAYEIGQE